MITIVFSMHLGGRFFEATIEDLERINSTVPEGVTSYTSMKNIFQKCRGM